MSTYLLVLGQEVGDSLPDGAGAPLQGEPEHRVGPPPGVLPALDHTCNGARRIHRRHALPQPLALHRCCRVSPHLHATPGKSLCLTLDTLSKYGSLVHLHVC